ncbi:MAG: sulfotransferase, partial [Candidatus Pacearchaeota archaeon]
MKKIIFIAGAGRSGSTILDIILGEGENCFSVGELRQIFLYFLPKESLCSCGNTYKTCRFWSEVLFNVFGKNDFSSAEINVLSKLHKIVEKIPILNSRNQYNYIKKFTSEIQEFKDIWKTLYQKIFEVSGCDIIIDSSKTPQYLLILKDMPFKVYLLHLIRDPRGVAYSWTKKKYEVGIYRYMKTHHPFTSAREWLIRNFKIERLKKFFNENYLLKYEEFCKAPLILLEDIMKKFDLKLFPDFIKDNTILIKKKKHLLGGNPVRFLNNNFIEIKCDERWKKDLSFGNKIMVSLLTFPLII